MAVYEHFRADGEALRRVMRRVPAPVVIVTVAIDDRRRGITIGSMTSVSLDPPLLAFNVFEEAETHDMLVASDRFAINVLTEDQAALAHHFSLPDRCGPKQFEDVPHTLTEDGLPVLDDALAVLVCTVRTVHDASDHSLFLAELEALLHQDLEARPLLYFDQGYRTVGSEVKSTAFSPVNRGSSSSS